MPLVRLWLKSMHWGSEQLMLMVYWLVVELTAQKGTYMIIPIYAHPLEF